MAMLEVKDINVYYGAIHAIKGISLAVEAGEIVTLIGANGAGKSTTLRTISGLLKPDCRRLFQSRQEKNFPRVFSLLPRRATQASILRDF